MSEMYATDFDFASKINEMIRDGSDDIDFSDANDDAE